VAVAELVERRGPSDERQLVTRRSEPPG